MNAFLIASLALAMSLSSLPAAPAQSINIKDSGAVGDGVADDTAAIQKALDGGKRTVVIPAGTYKISAALKLDSETTIRADVKAIIRLADNAGNDVGVFVLTNRDFAAGNHHITVDGGIWDGNNEHNFRGTKEQIPCYTGVAVNFINVQHLTLQNLTVRNPDSYAIRACHLTDFLIENIGFDFSVVRPNQDGVHLDGFCERGTIRNLRALSPYATNDDMVALNADDGAATEYAIQQGMVDGPIRNITVEHLRAESAFTFVRILSHQQVIENIKISDVVGGCRFYAVNMDRWRFPAGAGKIRNVTLRDFDVRKMPDVFSKQKGAGQRPLIHIQSAVQGFRIENFKRGENDEASAVTLALDNEQQNHLQLAGLTTTQAAELSKVSPVVAPAMLVGETSKTLQMDAKGKVTLPTGGFSLLTLDSAGLTSDTSPRKETFTASAEWQPIQWEPARIIKGSALDFSSLLEAPAGKFGEVVIRDGRFVFKNAPDKSVRLYGAVISHSLPYLDKARCEQLADYLAATGYSGVRLHNYTFAKGVMKEPGSTEFTPAAQDQLDYFFFCLKQRGLYFSFPINSWGFFKAGDVTDVPEFRDRAFRFESNGLLPISADLQRWFKSYALNLLTHVNPYTGLALKDDPALLSLELTNENALLAVLGQYPEFVPIYRRKCAEHLKAASGQDPTAEQVEKDMPRFVEDLQVKFFAMMKSFLREAGVQKPLTDLNFRDNMVYALPRAQLDYVDIHAYWALYQTLPKTDTSAEPAFRQTWVNPNSVGRSYYLGPVACRLFGKPYVNTEFNGCYPTPFWSFTGPVEATLAASQGWNAVFRCGHSADAARFFSAQPIHQIATSTSPIMMLSERIGSLLFAQGEMQPLPVQIPLVVTPEYLLAKATLGGGPKYPQNYSRLAFDYQLGTVLLDGHEQLERYPYVVTPADMEIPASLTGKKVLRADTDLVAQLKDIVPKDQSTPRLVRDPKTSAAQIVTAHTETFLLPGDVATAYGKTVRISGNQSVATCFAGSLDGKPLAESHRVLALYLTDVKNTGTVIEHEPKDTVVVRSEGKLPLLVRQGEVAMSFQSPASRALPQVWALKYDGSRSAKIEPSRTSDGFSFTAKAVTDPQTFSAFEVTWNE